MRNYKGWLLLLALWCSCLQVGAQTNSTKIKPRFVAGVQDDARCRQWVDSVVSGMSLREKVGQLFVYTLGLDRSKANMNLMRKVVENYKVGGLLFSNGLMENQVALTNEAQRMADVPLMITLDGEWGLSMRLRNTPVFPRNMVLGCIQDEQLLYEYGREVARQCREMGIHVNFAPVADVNINPKNPVINTRSFGESPANVARKVIAYSRGLEDGGVLSVSKHFPGHGDTDVDSHKALPILRFTRERLDSVEIYPFREAIRAGLGGIMVGHLEIPALEPQPGRPSSLSHNVVTGLLGEELGFDGLAFTDALEMKGVSGNASVCLQALKAGNDMLLVPDRIKEELETILQAVKKGELSEDFIEQKCRKVLTFKYAMGLNKRPFIRLSGLDMRLNDPQAYDLISRLRLAAITVLRNEAGTLPLDASVDEVAVVHLGDADTMKPFMDELSKYTRPVAFRAVKNATAQQARELGKALARYKRIVVCVNDKKPAGYGLSLAQLPAKIPVTYLCFVPGKEVKQLREVETAGAVLLAHSAEADVQVQSAKLLYGKAEANGRLSAGIGQLFALNDGVDYGAHSKPHYIPEEYGMSSRVLAHIDSIATEGIRKGAYPGCQVVVWKDGKEMYNKAFGTFDGHASHPVTPQSVYDLASLTKTTATLLAVMKLYDQGRLNLTDRVADILPFLQDTDKKNITVRDLLFHESGLPPSILFYMEAIDKDSYTGSLFKAKPDRMHPMRQGVKTWVNPNFRFREGLMSKVRTDEHTLQVCEDLWLNESFKPEFLKQIADATLKDKRYRYSCVGFIVLQHFVEAIAGMPLDRFVEQEFYAPMGLERTGYLPLRRLPKAEVVPSSVDSFLRKSNLQGFVHDEAAAFQGGVSGNAGLFSSAEEVARVYQMLLNGGELDGKRYLGKETCRLFTTEVSKISRRGLGFDKPDATNPKYSPCAESAPASVYGHTGFTGTCAWVDPDNGLVFVFLSNRIYPEVWNTKLMRLDIRTRLQEVMYEAMKAQ